MINLILTRRACTENTQTLGTMEIFKNGMFSGMIMTLEKPWKNNEKTVSCIPPGVYKVTHFESTTHTKSFQVQGVINRSSILIHIGNYSKDTQGCILPGLSLADINSDGVLDVIYSFEAMNVLRRLIGTEKNIELLIK